ncbi:hypothetical protein [Natronorubrum tibetense]|uniref:Uncharacterized protein n=1 Tax=Natronorubrum tibetense GA33 TaxID=1114856 RepID=L9VRN1_9EURY|nr:hypothetical protein [Natronorubrum tibetense]ELY39824.1 hypothetical protein C496_14141 [Natronorubrum tibetense GA33]
MSVDDIIDWPVGFGPIDAEIECCPIDVKVLANAMLSDSAAILGVNDDGVWIRSGTYRQGAHAHCPAEAFPEFECSTAGAVTVNPSYISTLRSATLSTDSERVSVSLEGDRLTLEANGFGGTVPTVIPERDGSRQQEIAEFDLRAIHDRHTAEADIDDWQFEDFLNWEADYPETEITLTPDGASITTPAGDSHWSWNESAGSRKATYCGQEFLDVFDQFYPVESTPCFTWGDDETGAMIFRRDDWTAIGYVIPVPESSSGNSRQQDESATVTRRCPECESPLDRDSSTGNWVCLSPQCGFRSITLE